jgi:hypothetical protein
MTKKHTLIALLAFSFSCVSQRTQTESNRPDYSKQRVSSPGPKDSTDADGWGVWPRNRTKDMPRPKETEGSPATTQPTASSVPAVVPSTEAAPSTATPSTTISPAEASALQQKVAELKVAVDTVSSRLQGAVVRTLKPLRGKPGKAFNYKPTNIKPTDTIYVDTLGVKMAMWLGPNGVKFRLGSGQVQEKGQEEYEIRPGFAAIGNWALNGVAAFGVLFIVYMGVTGYFQSKNQIVSL